MGKLKEKWRKERLFSLFRHSFFLHLLYFTHPLLHGVKYNFTGFDLHPR